MRKQERQYSKNNTKYHLEKIQYYEQKIEYHKKQLEDIGYFNTLEAEKTEKAIHEMKKVDLKNNPTASELAELFRPLDDTVSSHLLWVDFQGGVHVSPLSRYPTIKEFKEEMTEKGYKPKFWYEKFPKNYGFVGPDIADNLEFIESKLVELKYDWGNDEKGYTL